VSRREAISAWTLSGNAAPQVECASKSSGPEDLADHGRVLQRRPHAGSASAASPAAPAPCSAKVSAYSPSATTEQNSHSPRPTSYSSRWATRRPRRRPSSCLPN
jgi:hypothetical protein